DAGVGRGRARRGARASPDQPVVRRRRRLRPRARPAPSRRVGVTDAGGWPAAEGVLVVEALEQVLAEVSRSSDVTLKGAVEEGSQEHTWRCRVGTSERTFPGTAAEDELVASMTAWLQEVVAGEVD